jgi:hypothetical protein
VIARRDRAGVRADEREPAAPAAAPAERVPAPPRSPQQMLALQGQIGNAAVGRLLQRHEDHDGETAVAEPAQAAPGAPAAAKVPGQAAAEADAAETVTRIDKAIDVMAKTNDNPTVKNTSQLVRGPTPRVRFTPMTPRSDSETIRAARGQAAGSVVYFFTGTTQPALGATPANPPAGTLEKRPTVMGTIRGDATIIIRGRDTGGDWRTEEDFKHTLIHECSHILVKAYGEHEGTKTDAASFDRYKDEFRAYFVQQFGTFAEEKDLDKRAAKIKKHLIGTSLADTQGYPLLRNAYWTLPAGGQFRVDIDNHKRPDGFNLTNSVRLDRFFTALGPAATDPYGAVDEVMVAIAHMTAAERIEARASAMIKGKIEACGADAAKRIFAALDAPTTAEFTRGLNPGRSPRIAKLYEEIARGDGERLQAAYSALKADERVELQFNAATMVYIDHNILQQRKRACVYAMVCSRSATQYAAMEHFLDECFFTHIGTYGDAPTEIPADLRAAARGLTLDSRLALYRLVEDARRSHVDKLPPAVSKPLLLILRGDADP